MIRNRIFRFVVYGGLIILGIGLFRTQLMEGRSYRQMGEKNRIRLIPLEAPRGRVFDSKGNLLATNRISYDVVATPEDVTPEVFPLLARLLKVPEKTIRMSMSEAREYPFAPAVIKEDITKELAFRIEEYKPELQGVSIRVSSLRYYPYKETASHIIGYIGKISSEEYAKADRARFGMNSLLGRAGIEKIYDDRLRGWRGGRQIEVDARGRFIRVLSERKAEPGEDLYLTLDLEFQQKIMERVQGKHAAIAVMDLRNDGLLALVSTPGYDPNIFVSPKQAQERLEVLRDSDSPMMDRVVSSAYPPGSVFKLVTALAGLELKKITPATRFFCSGAFRLKPKSRPFHCWNPQGHGSMDVYQAIERSCNVFFYNVGSRLTADQIAKYAHLLGFGEPFLNLETTNITNGLVPDANWKSVKFRDKWYPGETLSYAIGQGYLKTSPLQVLRLSAVIAKNGLQVQPTLIQSDKKNMNPPKVAIHEENLVTIRRAMLKVVESDFGTGQLARVDFAKMAAKTGTAQAPPKEPHSWMTGFFPYDKPQVAFVVFVEHGGSGGITAAHIVKDMAQIWKGFYVEKVA